MWTVNRFSFLNLKEYNDNVSGDDVADDSSQAVINGAETSGDESDRYSVSSDELCEIQLLKANVKVARRVSKDDSS